MDPDMDFSVANLVFTLVPTCFGTMYTGLNKRYLVMEGRYLIG